MARPHSSFFASQGSQRRRGDVLEAHAHGAGRAVVEHHASASGPGSTTVDVNEDDKREAIAAVFGAQGRPTRPPAMQAGRGYGTAATV